MKKITLFFFINICMFTGIKSMENPGMDVENDARKTVTQNRPKRRSSKEKNIKNKHNQNVATLLEKNNDLLEQNNDLLRLNVLTTYLTSRYSDHHHEIVIGTSDPLLHRTAMKRIDGELVNILGLLRYEEDKL